MGVIMLIAFSTVVFSYVEPARDAIWTTRVTVPSAGGAVTFNVNVVRLPALTTAAPGKARTGSRGVRFFAAETEIESCAATGRATAAPLGPPVDWARRPTLTVLVASTVRFARVAPTADPPLGTRLTDHPNAARSSGFVIAKVTVSRALPEFVTRSV